LGDQIKKNEICEACRNYGKPEEKRALERPWLKWEDNIKKDLKEIGL